MKSQINFDDLILKSHNVVVQIPSEDAAVEFYRQYAEMIPSTRISFTEEAVHHMVHALGRKLCFRPRLQKEQYFSFNDAAFYKNNGYRIIQYDDLLIDEEELEPVDIDEFLKTLLIK